MQLRAYAVPHLARALGSPRGCKAQLCRVQSSNPATFCAPQVLARAIFELKYLVGFAVATIAVANHTREQADEAHCQMQAANGAAPSLLAVGEELLKVAAEELQTGADVSVSSLGVSSNSTALLMCLAEKKARLTHGWDLDDLEADVPLLALIGLGIATHLAAFLWTLRQAIKEKPVTDCHSNTEP